MITLSLKKLTVPRTIVRTLEVPGLPNLHREETRLQVMITGSQHMASRLLIYYMASVFDTDSCGLAKLLMDKLGINLYEYPRDFGEIDYNQLGQMTPEIIVQLCTHLNPQQFTNLFGCFGIDVLSQNERSVCESRRHYIVHLDGNPLTDWYRCAHA